VSDRPIRELIYNPAGDTLQMWLVEGPTGPTFNRPLDDDGMYAITTLGDPSELVGWEIVSFRHYASIHPRWRPLADSFERLPGGELIWREPSPGAGLEQLIPA